MRSQALLVESIIVFILVSVILLLTAPIHQDVGPYVKKIIENDTTQVKRLLGH